WVTTNARDHRALDEFHRIGAARVFRDAAVIEIRRPVLAQYDVLQHRAEPDRVPNLWLALFAQLDALGVAPALEIEHSLRGPAMLVVADEPSLRVSTQRGLAGATESEKQRRIP